VVGDPQALPQPLRSPRLTPDRPVAPDAALETAPDAALEAAPDEAPAGSAGEPLCLAVDIGGTKLAVGLVDRSGSLVFSDRWRTPRTTDGEALFKVVGDLVAIGLEAARARGEVAVVGVGCGGPMTAHGRTVSPLNIPAWRGFPLRRRLGDLLSSQKSVPAELAENVFVDNDAKALALGEGWVGAAADEPNYLAMVVSTGIGGGIVLDGRLLDGADGNAGHIGHVVVEPEGHECECGGIGCLEAEASGTAIARWTGRPAEEASREVVERCGRLVGRAIASVANLLDLRLAVVAGSVALGFGTPFFLPAQRELDRLARLDFSRGCRVEPAGLGPDAPLIGAAAVGWQALDRGRSS
jgi:glucokinase